MIETIGFLDLAAKALACLAALAAVAVAGYAVKVMRVLEQAELRNRGDTDDVHREPVGQP